MHVFVTGATGFVDSGVCGALLKEGHEVTGLTSKPEKAKMLEERGIKPVVGDMRDSSIVGKPAKEADVTITCAQLSFGSRFTKSRLKEMAEAEILHVTGVIEGASKQNRRIIYSAGYLMFARAYRKSGVYAPFGALATHLNMPPPFAAGRVECEINYFSYWV